MAAKVRKAPRRKAGYAPGERTRARIIAAAIAVFAERGYEGASTRMIASRAKTNLGSLQYHFGGKKDLYLACAHHITDMVVPQVEMLAAALATLMPAEGAAKEDYVASLSHILGLATEPIVGGDKNQGWLMFVSREQLSPGPAFTILYKKVVSRLIELFSGLIGRIIERPGDSEEAILATFVLMGPLFIFQRAKSVALHALGWSALDAERMEKLKALLVRQVLHGVTGPPGRRTGS